MVWTVFDAHQLGGVRLSVDVDVKILLSLTSTETNVKTTFQGTAPYRPVKGQADIHTACLNQHTLQDLNTRVV